MFATQSVLLKLVGNEIQFLRLKTLEDDHPKRIERPKRGLEDVMAVQLH